jgi:hypothetical protein
LVGQAGDASDAAGQGGEGGDATGATARGGETAQGGAAVQLGGAGGSGKSGPLVPPGNGGDGGAGGTWFVCNDVDWSFLPLSPEQTATGSPPDPKGGDIADGVYVLTMITDYGASSAGPVKSDSPYGEMLRFQGNTLDSVWMPQDEQESRSSYTLKRKDTTLERTMVCPDPSDAPESLPYTATSTAFMSYHGDVEYVYTKR